MYNTSIPEARDQTQKIIDLVTPETTFEELKQLVSRFIIPEDLRGFGSGKENLVGLVADSIAYLGAFASAPATFDEKAFFDTATLGWSETVGRKILEIDKRMGIMQDEPSAGPGRMSVTAEMIKMANQFLTDD